MLQGAEQGILCVSKAKRLALRSNCLPIQIAKNKTLPKEIECTFCIVGTGPAGAFLAVELAAQGHDVLLIDSGTAEPDVDTYKSIDSVSIEGGASLRFGFSRQFGGASNLWAGRVAPMEPYDFIKWPISYDEIKPFYEKAAKTMGVPFQEIKADPSPNQKEECNKFAEALRLVGLEEKKFSWNSPPFKTSQFLQKAQKDYSNLKIILGLQVTRLESTSSKIKFARATNDEGINFNIKSDYFIIAAGGLETPRILLNSNSKSAKGIGNSYGMVGKCLQTHPKADIGILKLNKRIGTNHPLFVNQQQSTVGARHGIGLNENRLGEVGGLNHYIQLTPVTEYQLQSLLDSAKNSRLLASRIIGKNKALNSWIVTIGLRVFDLIARLSNLQKKAQYFVVRGFFDQNPHLGNKIELSQEKDCNGASKINIVWRLSAEDKLSIRQFVSLLKDSFEKTDLGIFHSKLTEDADCRLVGIHSHFIGTARMGHDPKKSVVDSNCRVHEMENLYISGPAVFTTGGYANPFFTIAALSLRLASHLHNTTQQALQVKSKI